MTRRLGLPFYAIWVAKRWKADIVHCHCLSLATLLLGWLCLVFRIPTVMKYAGDWVWERSSDTATESSFAHAYHSGLRNKVLRRFQASSMRRFTAIWATSEYRKKNLEYLLTKTTSDRHSVWVIPNYLDLRSFRIATQRFEVADREPKVVLTAGRMAPHKRLEFLIDAFSQIPYEKARLVLVGGPTNEDDAKYWNQVAGHIARRGLDRQVTMTGLLSYDQVMRHMGAADVYVSASLEEGYPNVFVEAMAHGLPIVTSHVGGAPEIVEDQVTGYLIDPWNQSEFAFALQRLLESDDLRHRMSRAARARARSLDLHSNIDSFMRMYESTVRDPRARRRRRLFRSP